MKSTEQTKPRWVPVVLLVLSLLTISMLVVAVGVMLDILPAWAPNLEAVGTGNWSGVNTVLPIASSLVGAVFVRSIGIITLIGGAIYSAWVFWRKQILAHRALGNVLIAGAAILGGGGSAFARFGMLT